MKLDMDLIRQILIEVEDRTRGDEDVNGRTLELNADWDWDVVHYHLTLLIEEEWIDARHSLGKNVRIGSLTWRGHKALADMRNETVWAKVKQELVRVGGAASLEGVLIVVKNVARALGLEAG